MSESIIPKNLDYKIKTKTSSRYKLQRIGPSEGTPTLSLTSTVTSTFVIPSAVHNHSKSFLRFDFTPTAGGGGNYNFVHCNTLPIQNIVLRDEANQKLCDISYLNKFVNVVCNDSISCDELVTQDLASTSSGYFSGFRPCNSSLQYQGLVNPTDAAALVVAAQALTTEKRLTNSNIQMMDNERKYWIGGTANAQTPVLYYRIPMNLIKKSFFNQDINIYHNRNLFMEVTWAPVQSFMSISTNIAQPYTGPAVPVGGAVANVYYDLAIQTDESINAEIKGFYNSGKLSYVIPSVLTGRIARNTAGAQYVEVRVSRAHGMKLLDIYTAPYHSTETANTAYEHSNVAAARISSLMPSLNDQQLYPTRIDCANAVGDDYQAMKNKLVGSMTQSSDIYRYNWFWHDSFHDNDDDQNVIDGIDLSTEQKYSLDITGVGTTNLFYTFVITSKLAMLRPDGLLVQ